MSGIYEYDYYGHETQLWACVSCSGSGKTYSLFDRFEHECLICHGRGLVYENFEKQKKYEYQPEELKKELPKRVRDW